MRWVGARHASPLQAICLTVSGVMHQRPLPTSATLRYACLEKQGLPVEREEDGEPGSMWGL